MVGSGIDVSTGRQSWAASGAPCSISCHQSLFGHPVEKEESVAKAEEAGVTWRQGDWEAGENAHHIA